MPNKRVDYIRVHLAAGSLTSVYFEILADAYEGMGSPKELVYTRHRRELREASISDGRILKAQAQKHVGVRVSVCLGSVDLVEEMVGNWHYDLSDGVLTLTDKCN